MGIKKETGLSLTDFSSAVVKTKGIGHTSGDDLLIYSNHTDTYPYIELRGNGDIRFYSKNDFYFYNQTQVFARLDYENSGAILYLKETTTPTAITNFGAIYTKNDNKIYFQDGAGTEHEIAFV